jgi:hypothetical protein
MGTVTVPGGTSAMSGKTMGPADMTADPGAAGATARRQIRSITYEHEGDRYEVIVGSPRRVYRRRTGPRGGYIKNAGQKSWSTGTGSVVTGIEPGDPFCVWSEVPSGIWDNPSLVGQHEIRHIEYFDDAAAEADATTES